MRKSPVIITECPRDAMQGIHNWIPTEAKIKYINLLLKAGFDIIDFGSFVAPRAVPQMKDTAKVLKALDWDEEKAALLAIVGNQRGAIDALMFDQISYLGFPFSISETFQLRNLNSSFEDSVKRVAGILTQCNLKNKKLLVYISMAFGNPYGEHWHPDIAIVWIEKLMQMGVKYISLADTVGMAKAADIQNLLEILIAEFPKLQFGIHLHTTPYNWEEKVHAAFMGGCRQFDVAIKGFGGCPMAQDDLLGNLATENLLAYLSKQNLSVDINQSVIKQAGNMAMQIMG